jgi:hypothetical protein
MIMSELIIKCIIAKMEQKMRNKEKKKHNKGRFF